jgi:hypothetical protein
VRRRHHSQEKAREKLRGMRVQEIGEEQTVMMTSKMTVACSENE